MGLKIAVSGKGGVGKTLVAGTLARLLARRGFKVLAIDADSNPNLHVTLGIRAEKLPMPVSVDEALIEEKTGARPGGWGIMFSLNPRVDDIPERYSIVGPNGVRLLIVGAPRAGAGCMCPQNALIRALLDHVVLERDEVVVVDSEAGLEPFSRATVRSVDLLLVVIEPTRKSLDAAVKIASYARELGVRKIWSILNKVVDRREAEEFSRLAEEYDLDIRAVVPFDSNVSAAERAGASIFDYCEDSSFILAIEKLCSDILREFPQLIHHTTSRPAEA
ncbi:MAG: AAA family ATPase [Sulfolobales archaeon]